MMRRKRGRESVTCMQAAEPRYLSPSCECEFVYSCCLWCFFLSLSPSLFDASCVVHSRGLVSLAIAVDAMLDDAAGADVPVRVAGVTRREQEVNGGRTSQKLGFVDMDLAEFAGAGLTCKRCLLEGYSNTHHRSDNSSLKLLIEMTLLSGDPLFKRPTRGNSSFYAPLPDMQHLLSLADSSSLTAIPSTPHPLTSVDHATDPHEALLPLSNSSTKDSLTEAVAAAALEAGIPSPPAALAHSHHASTSSSSHPSSLVSSLVLAPSGAAAAAPGCGTSGAGATAGLPAVPSTPSLSSASRKDPLPAGNGAGAFESSGHSRNSSQQSKASVGYGSLPAHSRHGSTPEADFSEGTEVETTSSRVDATRINPEDVIQELVAINLARQPTEEDEEENPDDVGLEIFVSKDGTATLGSRTGTNDRRSAARHRKHRPKLQHQPTPAAGVQ